MQTTPNEYHFGVGRGKVSAKVRAKVEAIAKRHGADFSNPTLPGDGPCYWFTCPNRGAPFDGQTARAVTADVEAAGLDIAKLADA